MPEGRPGFPAGDRARAAAHSRIPGDQRRGEPKGGAADAGSRQRGDACPVFPGRRYEEWVLEDPAGHDVDGVRPIRDEIGRRVRHLLTDLEVRIHA